jgi:hypothetical protein
MTAAAYSFGIDLRAGIVLVVLVFAVIVLALFFFFGKKG